MSPKHRAPVVQIATDFKTAREQEIEQYARMSAEERHAIARTLKRRVYGPNPPDVRASERAK